jgi:hypothetical protein
MGPFVGEFGAAVASGKSVAADDGHHDDLANAGPLADVMQVPGRGGEKLGGRILVRRPAL